VQCQASLFATLVGVAYTLALHTVELPALMGFKVKSLHVDSRTRQLFFLQFIGVASIIVVVALHLAPFSAEEELRVVHADFHNLEMGLAAVNATLSAAVAGLRGDVTGLRGDVAAIHTNIVALNSTMHSAVAAIVAELRRNPT